MSSHARKLTKSRFTLAMECPTKLYYTGKKDYANNKGDNEFLISLAEGGFQVGELAKQYYPGGTDIEEKSYQKSIDQTNKLLQNENVIIYEAAITFKNLFIRVDILKKVGNKIELIEVKAKSFDSESPDFLNKSGFIDLSWRPYLNDIAFQTYVVENAFSEWQVTPYLMLADKAKRATVNDLNQFFRIKKNPDDPQRKECHLLEGFTLNDLGEPILSAVNVREYIGMIYAGDDIPQKKKTDEQRKLFYDRINEYTKYYINDERYPISISGKCKSCEFRNNIHPDLKSGYEECWKAIIGESFDQNEPHIFDIWYSPKKDKFLNEGIFYMRDIDIQSHFMKTNREGISEPVGIRSPRQILQIEKVQHGDWTEDIKVELFDEMDNWNFPLHFIDFESSTVAIPFYEGRRPYEQTAFQFSCHTLHKDQTITHHEWINIEPGVFPNFEFVAALKKILENDIGTIFRFADHENTVLRQIKDQMEFDNSSKYAELIDFINLVTEKKSEGHFGSRSMVDLNKMVQSYYYHQGMGGSNGLKTVLPAIMNVSPFLKEKYSKPLEYGKWLKGIELWKFDKNKGKVKDPYSLLPSLFDCVDNKINSFKTDQNEIKDGGAAMMAYAYMQFSDMPNEERKKIVEGLLRYCELDTLAMVMFYEHWNYLKSMRN